MRKITKRKQKLCISEILRNKLKFFGLNPNNWTLVHFSKNHKYMIINKKNKDFRLIGTPYLKDRKKPKLERYTGAVFINGIIEKEVIG